MEMKASLCVGEYCETAYNIEELEIRVYCMEELCYCLKENAFLLDMSIMNDKLVDWIGEAGSEGGLLFSRLAALNNER